MVSKLQKAVLWIVALNMVVYTLKEVTHVQRPNVYNYRSFPSGHAANAWYLATLVSFNPFATALATLVSYTRVSQGWHSVLDVVVGSALGIAAAKSTLSF